MASVLHLSVSLVSVSLCLSLVLGDIITVQLFVNEESPPGAHIGDLRSALRSKLDSQILHQAQFSLLPRPNQNLSGFTINRTTGHLSTTSSPLDRETICPQPRPVECMLDLSVGVFRDSQLETIVSAKVLVLDINDNAPTFAHAQYDVRISELSDPGTTLPLPVATDLDTPQFGIQTYRLRSNFQEFQLKLVNGTGQGSSPTPHLTLTKRLRLDPEPYSLTLEALDWGVPSKSGSTTILVTVEDANDHAPTFDHSSVQIKVREDHPLDVALYQAKATDDDRGLNAEVSYMFAPATNSFHGETFLLDRSSGQLFLRRSLNFESENTYQLDVLAVDSGAEPQTGLQTIVVTVEDVNDNAPQLTINTLSSRPPSGTPRENFVEVAENTPPKSFVAHVSVYDADSGPNGQVSCRLLEDAGKFSLDLMAAGQYKLTTLAEVDYETDHAFVVTVECSDNGQPMMTRRLNVTIGVVDLNDNEPYFTDDHFNVTIQENNVPDSPILKVKATDADSGLNAKLVFSILEPFASQFVNIDPDTGLIKASQVLDLETINTLSFTVRVVDSAQPFHSATVPVTINIEDVNDEEPKFVNDSYDFSIRENSPPGTLVGFVSAVDRDSPPFNQFIYKIIDAFSTGITDLFAIDPRSGKIIAKETFDRELKSEYRCTVSAIDQDRPALRSEAIVRIRIEDENDNYPIIIYPPESVPSDSITSGSSSDILESDNSSFAISNLVPRGYVIMNVVARDPDAGDNARLTYRLANANELFSIDPRSGALATNTDFQAVKYDRHRVRVTVHDSGRPPRTSAVDVTVVVDALVPFEEATTAGVVDGGLPGARPPNSKRGPAEGDDESESNSLFIIIAVACTTAALLVLIIIVVVAVKVFERRNQPQAVYHCREQERKVMDKMAAKNHAQQNEAEEEQRNICSLKQGNSNHSIDSQKIKDDRSGENARAKTVRGGGGGANGNGNQHASDSLASLERKLLWELKEEDRLVDVENNSSMTDVSGDSGLGASEENDRFGFSHHFPHLNRVDATNGCWYERDPRQSYSLPRNSQGSTTPYFASTFRGLPHSTTQLGLPAKDPSATPGRTSRRRDSNRTSGSPMPPDRDGPGLHYCAQPQTLPCPDKHPDPGEIRRYEESRRAGQSLVDEIRKYKTRMAKFPAHSSALRNDGTGGYRPGSRSTFYRPAAGEEDDEDDYEEDGGEEEEEEEVEGLEFVGLGEKGGRAGDYCIVRSNAFVV